MASKAVLNRVWKMPQPGSMLGRRFQSSSPQIRPKNANSRFDRINSRLPRFLQKYTSALKNAPVTHISAFLLLHEITAIVPLFGLAATFHYAQWLPPYISEGKYISDYVEKFGRYFRKKGWLGEVGTSGRDKWWGRGEGATKIIVELATAWAITKVLLPIRLVASVWATPWFARVAILPVTNVFRRIFRSNKAMAKTAQIGPAAAGTGATAAAGVGKEAKPSTKST